MQGVLALEGHGLAWLRRCMESDLVRAPGVADALTARLAEDAGFTEALYVSGGAVARGLGMPDVGLVGASEMVQRVAEIRAVTQAALVVDGDTGYGSPIAAARAVRALARAGAAAVHIEDQADPKRCAEYGGVVLADLREAAARIRAATLAAAGDVLVIARTDALPVRGRDEAARRARLYVEAGAHMVFVEGVREEEDIAAVAKATERPLMLNAADLGRAHIDLAAAERLGCRLVIFPAELQRAAIRAIAAVARALRRDGSAVSVQGLLADDAEREGAVRRDALAAFERDAYRRLGRNGERDTGSEEG